VGAKSGVQTAEVEVVSARFVLLRRETAALLEMIGEEVWRLKWRLDEYGGPLLRELIEDYITHTAEHLDKMRSAVVAYRSFKHQTASLIARFRGTEMTRTKDKNPPLKETKDKETKDKETKDKEPKGKSNLVGRVKKVIKKSRRKLGEEKFEKELRRTIEFLAQLQTKLDDSHSARDGGKALAKIEKKPAPRAGKKAEQQAARNAPKKAQPDKKGVKKPAGNGVGKKRKGLQIEDSAGAAESRAALQVEALSKER